ncbi:MAG: CPBP family intramembrane metalloprotease [Clostridia bacterium]|nr:CPBP family intramembrane metalloprotease [Clostridia bacterium]
MKKIISAKVYAILSVILSTLLMCVVDGVISPPYVYKSAIKIVLFLFVPLVYFAVWKEKSTYLKQLFVPKKKGFLLALSLGLAVFAVILGAYFALRSFIDFSGIKDSLTSGIGVNADNFLFVAIYISFVNSLLEEFFFRGFAFLVLKQEVGRTFAYVFSAATFALYHVGITSGWFNPWIYLLSMLGLFVGGGIFNFLNDKLGNIYPSWLVHMFANFAINTIGFILFGIL